MLGSSKMHNIPRFQIGRLLEQSGKISSRSPNRMPEQTLSIPLIGLNWSWFNQKLFRWRKSTKKCSLRSVAAKYADQHLQLFNKAYLELANKEAGHTREITTVPKRSNFQAPKNPIVLCHGLSGFDRLILLPSIGQLTKLLYNVSSSNNADQLLEQDAENSRIKGLLEVEYWFGVKQALEAKGCTVISAKVPGFSSIEERARTLNECIERETRYLRLSKDPNEVYNSKQEEQNNKKENGKQKPIKVNLIAHSMGGLDCRYLISNIKNRNFDVVSLTTVSTPHHGSEMADFVVGFSSDVQKGIPKELPMKILPPAFYELTTKSMEAFNKATPDDPNVAYLSYGASMKPKWYNLFYTSWHIVFDLSKGEPNDGLVSVKSSRWGEYMGTIQNADHLDIINWKNRLQKEVVSLVFGPSNSVKRQMQPDVDMLDFYLGVADNLARRGF
ncbi:LANO_0G02630g1_1 [Lachancea nothofagi CBS 11611]|uniref:GPI inositol-deacylase n=1 Tax=Lachancea nothofagi CBS 11611 TaxID=1266666 RepID=A0A1G4KF42_9SACH|nr:LANO_0G02630g1_1 [Lachancea nothofagi CBS 11611]